MGSNPIRTTNFMGTIECWAFCDDLIRHLKNNEILAYAKAPDTDNKRYFKLILSLDEWSIETVRACNASGYPVIVLKKKLIPEDNSKHPRAVDFNL